MKGNTVTNESSAVARRAVGADDELALRALATAYAIGADSGDAAMFTSAFLPDAHLRVFRQPNLDTPMTDMVGHEQLARIPSMLRKRYTRTFHFLGQCAYEFGAAEARGQVYCLAHHLTVEPHGGTNYVMHMRYLDEYRRDGDGAWKIGERVAYIDWTDTRAANPPGT